VFSSQPFKVNFFNENNLKCVLVCAGKRFTVVATVPADQFSNSKREITHPTSGHLSIKLKQKLNR